jgi:hypothetical protein
VARVYVSLPLTGPSARPGRDLLRGAELALEQAEPIEPPAPTASSRADV